MITAKLLLAYLIQASAALGINIDESQIDLNEAYCLAKNVYYEARNESLQGQFAVASVTMNRVSDPRYPDTVCEVVEQKTVSRVTKKKVCQFSWFCEPDKIGKEVPVTKSGEINQAAIDQFQVASMVALTVLSGSVEDNTKGATHFHNPYTSFPAWRHELKRTMRVGNHDFYKLPQARM